MRDKISIERNKENHPAIREEVPVLIDEAESKLPPNVAIRIVEWIRTIVYQNSLYAKGRTTPGPNASASRPMGDIVTKAKGGSSYHNYGLAIDIAFVVDKDGNGTFETLEWGARQDFNKNGIADWREIVKIFTDAGYRWGADWDQDGKTKAEGDKDEHLVDAPHLEKSFGYSVHQLYEKYLNKDFIEGTTYVKI